MTSRSGKGRPQPRPVKRLLRRFILFAAVGIACTTLQYAILVALVSYRDWPVTPASSVGFIASALANYALNYSITFNATLGHYKALPRFAFMAGTGLLLNGLILQIGLIFTPLPYLAIQIAATLVVLFWNFVGSLKWSFAS